MARILVVDDKEMMRDSVATTLARRSHSVTSVASAKAALDKLSNRQFDAVLTDLQMPEMDGLELLTELRRLDDQMPVILMTAYGTIETAVTALKQGAYDYILKPFSGDVLQITVERALEHGRLRHENQILKVTARETSAMLPSHTMIGSGQMITHIKSRLARMADSHGTVLISGESGSGKEVAARFIHEQSPRSDAPLLAINCAALSTSLLESELFGHEKGAFTGADKLRKGRFELADGGTLLLDEISEIGPEIQAKLLRVLQERTFERVGSSSSRTVDVRVIATTNRDLTRQVQAGDFRQDLYFRLNVLPVTMPSLREHPEDITDLTTHFLGEVARREGRPAKRLDEDALKLFTNYAWPGNVRELHNICERAAVLTAGEVITGDIVGPWLEFTPALASPGLSDSMIEPGRVCDGSRTLEDIERETIIATLQHHNGHRQRSAAALGIGVRTLGLKLKRWKELELVEQTL